MAKISKTSMGLNNPVDFEFEKFYGLSAEERIDYIKAREEHWVLRVAAVIKDKDKISFNNKTRINENYALKSVVKNLEAELDLLEKELKSRSKFCWFGIRPLCRKIIEIRIKRRAKKLAKQLEKSGGMAVDAFKDAFNEGIKDDATKSAEKAVAKAIRVSNKKNA